MIIQNNSTLKKKSLKIWLNKRFKRKIQRIQIRFS